MEGRRRALEAAVSAESYDGTVLVQSITDNPVCSFLIDSAIPCLCLLWRKNPSSLQLRFVLERLIEIACQEHLPSIVGDDGPLMHVDQADQAWIAEDWMPRAVASGVTRLASVQPYTVFGQRALESVQLSMPDGLARETFQSIEHAKQWLAGKDQQLV